MPRAREQNDTLLRYLGAIQRGRAALRHERSTARARHEYFGAEILEDVMRDLQRVAECVVRTYLPDFRPERDPEILAALIEGVGRREVLPPSDRAAREISSEAVRAVCIVCLTPFAATKSDTKYCSNKCCARAYRHRKQGLAGDPRPPECTKPCEVCGRPFITANGQGKHCSRPCTTRAYRERKLRRKMEAFAHARC